MSRFGGLDGLEVALLGEVSGCSIGREVRGVGLPCGGVKFFSEEGKLGGTTRASSGRKGVWWGCGR